MKFVLIGISVAMTFTAVYAGFSGYPMVSSLAAGFAVLDGLLAIFEIHES